MAASIQINSGTPGVSDDNLVLGASCTLYSFDAATTYTWAIVSQPAGPLDAIVGSGRTVTFTPTKEGSYLVNLIIDDNLPTESSQQLVAAVRELETGDRIPAIGETTENSANDGWANPVDAILERVTRFEDAGVLPGVAGAAGLAIGNVVYASGVYTLADTLPGARVVPSWVLAQADDVAAMQGVFGVLVGSVNGGTIAVDDVVRVLTTGLYQGVPYGTEPSVGDAVYITDAGGLGLTTGTIVRQIGTVCSVDTGATTFDVMVGPAPAEIDAPAGGDLSGTFPDPTVVGLQGRPVASTAPSAGEVLGWSGSAWAPTSNSAPPTGAAGGVLGYAGSTYPNPNGLATNGTDKIPVKPQSATAQAIIILDSQSSASALGNISVRGAENTGSGDGGAALLVGGASAAAEPGTMAAGGATSTTGGGASVLGGLGPVGGSVTIIAGQGDTTSGGAVTISAGLSASGVGADVTVTAGESLDDQGGSVQINGGEGSVYGGAVVLTGGIGADGGAVSLSGGVGASGAGGDAGVVAGNGIVGGGVLIVSGDGSSGPAGAVDVRGGVGYGGAGGPVNLNGGSSVTHSGGTVTVAGGTASSLGTTSGSVSVDSGAATGLASAGVVSIGIVNAQSVTVGRSGKDVLTNGRNVGVPTTYAPLAATTIPVNGPTISLNPAANRDMTASPTLQTSGITSGTIVTLVNEDSTSYVDLTQDAGGTSYLKLATGNIYLYKYDTITFIFDGTYWVEVGRNVQPGKSYTPVAGTTIPFLCPSILLANAGAVNLGTANATIQTSGINAGSRVTFVQKGAGTTTFSRGGSSGLKLTNPSHALSQYATLELVFDGTFWCQLSQANNA